MSYDTLFQKQIYSIKAKSMLTVNFPSFNPNYFRVVNLGSGEIYFSTSTSPTPNRFDMKVQPQGSKMHVEPYGKTSVYFYNDGAHDSDFILLAFNAEFNPVALAVLSDESLADVIGEQDGYDGIIRGFTIPLPSGSNTIGKVDLNSNSQLTAIKNAVDAVKTAVAGNLKLSTNTQLTDIKTAVDGVKTAVENISIPSGGGGTSGGGIATSVSLNENAQLGTIATNTANVASLVSALAELVNHRKTYVKTYDNTSSNTVNTCVYLAKQSGHDIKRLCMFTNDGTADLKVRFKMSASGGNNDITVKAGETLTDVNCYGAVEIGVVTVSGAVNYRAVVEFVPTMTA